MSGTIPNIARAKPQTKPTATKSEANQHQGHSWLMMACCVAMVGGVAYLLWSAPTNQSLTTTILSAAPLLICVGFHLVMHRFMGKSCHSQTAKKDQTK